METTTQAALARWGDFYLMTGGAAAVLTGLQFVVQMLMASGERRIPPGSDPGLGIATFGTPVVVSGFGLAHGAEWGLFVIGDATMLLLFVGIHNSWDTITYLTVSTMRGDSAVVVESAATIVAADEAAES
jgi:hypothetical protein